MDAVKVSKPTGKSCGYDVFSTVVLVELFVCKTNPNTQYCFFFFFFHDLFVQVMQGESSS